jgi:hypothetical protein
MKRNAREFGISFASSTPSGYLETSQKRPETEGGGQVAKSEKVKSSEMLRNLGFMEEISIYKLIDHVFYLIDYGHYKLNKCTMMNGTIWRWFVD